MTPEEEVGAFTDGDYDRVFDSVVISVGKSVIGNALAAKTAIGAGCKEPVRVLFVQTKMSEYINAEDVTSFGAAARRS